jgi:hypothetical protein
MWGFGTQVERGHHALRSALLLALALHLLLAALLTTRLRLSLPIPAPQPDAALVVGLDEGAPAPAPAEARRNPAPAPRARAPAPSRAQAPANGDARPARRSRANPGRQTAAAPQRDGARPEAPGTSGASLLLPGQGTREAVDAAVADPRWQLRLRDLPARRDPDPVKRAVAGSARPPCWGASAPIRGGGLLAIPGLIYDVAEGNCSP